MRGFPAHVALAALLWFEGSASAQGEQKQARIKQLQRASRVYQVCLGRGLKLGEATKVLTLKPEELAYAVAASPEAAAEFSTRLTAFVGSPFKGNAQKNLAEVLAPAKTARHRGHFCGPEVANVNCFASWLVARVAPSLGDGWVKEHDGDLAGWSYARLLEAISASSLTEG